VRIYIYIIYLYTCVYIHIIYIYIHTYMYIYEQISTVGTLVSKMQSSQLILERQDCLRKLRDMLDPAQVLLKMSSHCLFDLYTSILYHRNIPRNVIYILIRYFLEISHKYPLIHNSKDFSKYPFTRFITEASVAHFEILWGGYG